MRILLSIIFIAIAGSAGYGFYIKPEDYSTGELFIGLSIAGLFFIWMPIFIYHRWRKRNFKDYMLTKENIDKMRDEGKEKKL
ncbi:hypothetical protein INR76_02990 [Marixanthomonas sp. SCSIO 43207]|uniref:hypothetical protein n=1 Tax=Marixanthomonas sp. SCSIO 43207 TaxID=2779360 RepID=UPI001CAA369A|nr:hypothetical protein [Marixanthomonas sp. SCSIO 43207]UAB81739.1 hypothetical protein INR76_02990 [Marixanthomonas sp. SCSIO 43207]